MGFSIIPDIDAIEEFLSVSKRFGLGFEYNDFCYPKVYEDEAEVDKLIEYYQTVNKKNDRDTSFDTMHGAFLGLDLAASDTVIRKRSRNLYSQSLQIARRLNVKGVVFHTGLLGTLRLDYYIDNWLNEAEAFWKEQCKNFPDLVIYMENSFEQSPEVFVRLMKRMEQVHNFKICFDYAHAILTPCDIEIWCRELSPYIGHMHINDNDLKDDLHLVPGEGKIDFDRCKQLIDKYDIKTSMLLEIKGIDSAKRALEFMQKKFCD